MNVCHMNVCHMLFLVVKASVQDEHLIRQFSVAKPMPQAYHVGMILYPPQSDWGWFTNGPQAPVRITELSRDRIAKTGYAKAYSSAFATKKGSQLAVAIETLYHDCDLHQVGKVDEQTCLVG